MKLKLLAFLTLAATPFTVPTVSLAQEGAAIAIVYDTSGSMYGKIEVEGKQVEKYKIANAALEKVVAQVDAYAKTGQPVEAGLIRFQDPSGKYGVKFGPWAPERFREWLQTFNQPAGGTPLGLAVRNASETVSRSKIMRKHVVVITDGENNGKETVAQGMAAGRKLAERAGTAISYYFIAFDTSTTRLEEARKAGALIFSAANAEELQKQLNVIFSEKILLEAEE